MITETTGEMYVTKSTHENSLTCKFTSDGSFSVWSGPRMVLGNCYPGMDGRSIRAQSVKQCGKNSYMWITAAGNIYAAMEECAGGFQMRYTLEDFQRMPHIFYFFFEADAFFSGIYQTAESMGEAAGYITGKELLERSGGVVGSGICSFDIGSGRETGAVTVYAAKQEHYKTFFRAKADADQPDGEISGAEAGKSLLSTGVWVEHVSRKRIELPPLKFVLTDNVSEGLERAAGEIGKNMGARLFQPPAYHWCSWYYYYQNFSMRKLEKLLEDMASLEERPDIRYIQIDAGYFAAPGDWLKANERFPGGLKPAFECILRHGYIPGIWVAPFMVGNRSMLYKDHPDWILRDLEDRPLLALAMDNEAKLWGYQDEEYYILDTSHPDAAAYIKHVFETLYSWGARMFKIDFLLWGFLDSSRVKRYTSGDTSVEYFRSLLQLIREAIREESYLLACIAPFLPCVGYVDAMRIGVDVGADWTDASGSRNMLESLLGNHYMNQNFFQNDPDAIILRDFHTRLTDRETEGLAFAAALSGGCIYTSDPLPELSVDRGKLFRFIRPDIRRKPVLPYLTEKRSELVMTHSSGHRALVYILNKSEEPLTSICKMEALGFDPGWNVFEFPCRKKVPLWQGSLVTVLKPHEYRLYILTKEEGIAFNYSCLWKNLTN